MVRKIAAALFVLSSVFAAGDTIHAGLYQGEWNGAYGNGNVSITLERDGKAGYRADVTMTVDPEEMDCDVESLKVDGAKIVLVLEYGNRNRMQMTLMGTLKGRTIEGQFKTRQPGTEAVDDEGTWRAVRL
jgi:hypothetical protein